MMAQSAWYIIASIILAVCAGCLQDMPRSESPYTLFKPFAASADKTWEAAQHAAAEAASSSAGAIVARHDCCRIICFWLDLEATEAPVYINVYVRARNPKAQDNEFTEVGFSAITQAGGVLHYKEIEHIEKLYFEKIDTYLDKSD